MVKPCLVSYIDTGAVIGIVVGCLAGLALICGIIMFCIRNKQNKPAKKEPSKEILGLIHTYVEEADQRAIAFTEGLL